MSPSAVELRWHFSDLRQTMQTMVFCILMLFITASHASPSCNSYTDCASCAGSEDWFPGSSCRWCPAEAMCHSRYSVYDTCTVKQIVTNPQKCSAQPPPCPPAPVPSATSFAQKTITSLFRHLNISVDPSACVDDVGRADIQFRDFALDARGRNVTMALTSLSRGLYAVSSAVSPCGVPQLKNRIDMLASAIHWADVAAQGTKVVVGAKDLWNDMAAIGTAVSQNDTTAVGIRIGKLMASWSTIVGGCIDPTHTAACTFLDGFLKLTQQLALNAKPCGSALQASLNALVNATSLFHSKRYQPAVLEFAAGLDGVSKAISEDSCGLKSLGKVIGEVVPKFQAAIVKVESSASIKILVGSADVYDELYRATMAIQQGDASSFGEEMGALFNKLRSSGCETKSCVLMQGILAALQVEAKDFVACSKDLDAAWGSIPTAISQFETGTAKGVVDGLTDIARFVTEAAEAVGNCGVPDLGNILSDTASKLGSNATAADIGIVVQALVSGSDVTHDVAKLLFDAKAGQWLSVGHDLGALSTWLNSMQCTTYVCKLTEGLLHAVEIPFQNLTGCRQDLSQAERVFSAASYSMFRLDLKGALTYFSNGLQVRCRCIGYDVDI